MSQSQALSSSQDLQARFENLLKPIRDLEQNWSIDLVEELAEALKDLEMTPLNFGNGETIIDFGKAALLIQGGAHVYSKKVDYLYRTYLEIKDWLFTMWNAKKAKSGKDGEITAASAAGQPGECSDDEDWDERLIKFMDVNETCNSEDEDDECTVNNMSTLLPPLSCIIGATERYAEKRKLFNPAGDVIGHMSDFITSSLSTQSEKTGWLFTDYADYEKLTGETDRLHQANPIAERATADCINPLSDRPDENDKVLESDNDEGFDDIPALELDAQDKSFSRNPIQTAENTPVAWRHAMQRRKRADAAALQQAEPEIDPWTDTLDPHEILPRISKPLKIGNCRKLPPSLRKGIKRGQTGAITDAVVDIASFCNKEFATKSCSAATGPLLFTGFDQLFSDRLKERLDKIRKIQRARRSVFDCLADENDDCNGPADDDDIHDDDDCDSLPFSRMQANPSNQGVDYQENEREDILQLYMKNHYDHMVHHEQLTDIDRRVRLWEQSVKDVILATEQHTPFDVVHYSNGIIDSFADENANVHFENVVNGKPRYEAYRMFVSTLTLANHGNIQIVPDSSDHMEISLLSKRMLSEAMMEDMPQSQLLNH